MDKSEGRNDDGLQLLEGGASEMSWRSLHVKIPQIVERCTSFNTLA